jgi:hypothetical protein
VVDAWTGVRFVEEQVTNDAHDDLGDSYRISWVGGDIMT